MSGVETKALEVFWTACDDEYRGDLPAEPPEDLLERYVSLRIAAALTEAATAIETADPQAIDGPFVSKARAAVIVRELRSPP